MRKALTSKKLEYLYFLYLKKDDFVRQIYLVKLFDVTKVTVSSLIADLETDGYVEKNEKKSVRITEKGIAEISEYIPNIEKITEWFCDIYELEKPGAIFEAVRFCANMDKNTVSRVIKEFEHRKLEAGTYTYSNIKPGKYEIHFFVLRNDESKLSMGDIGFVKPCRLICDENGCRLTLRASEIRYRLLSGKLAALKYRNKFGEYVLSEHNGDSYSIPGTAFTMSERDGYITVRIFIKALASCGVIHMPESEAVIRFRMQKDLFVQQPTENLKIV